MCELCVAELSRGLVPATQPLRQAELAWPSLWEVKLLLAFLWAEVRAVLVGEHKWKVNSTSPCEDSETHTVGRHAELQLPKQWDQPAWKGQGLVSQQELPQAVPPRATLSTEQGCPSLCPSIYLLF